MKIIKFMYAFGFSLYNILAYMTTGAVCVKLLGMSFPGFLLLFIGAILLDSLLDPSGKETRQKYGIAEIIDDEEKEDE